MIKKLALLFLSSLIALSDFSTCLAAEVNTWRPTTSHSSKMPRLIPAPPRLTAKAYVVMDALSGAVIAKKNAQQRLAPASLTKLMTLYITFLALQNGQIKLSDTVHISRKAWKMSGSRMFLKPGERVSVQDLIQGIIVASGNDACVALAEFIAGNEASFSDLMNQAAHQLKMNATHYVDSTGLPNSKHYTTPYDMALLTQAIIRDFPQYYHFFKQKWFSHNHIKQPNRNRLLWRDPRVDGLKTGHTNAAGYCLISSATENDMRLITVVMGAPSDAARANNSEALINFGFRFYTRYTLFDPNTPMTQSRTYLGREQYTPLGVEKPLSVSIAKSDYQKLQAHFTLSQPLRAPVQKNQRYGTVTVKVNDTVIATAPLVALKSNPSGGFFRRMLDHVLLFIHG